MATLQFQKKILTVNVRDKRTRCYSYENITEWNQWEKVTSSLDSYFCWSPPVVLGHTVCSIGSKYIFHTVWMNLGIISFSKIFLTVLFDTLTNNVSFLFLFLIKYLFKYVALLCIYIIVIVLLLIYMWDFNSFMYNGYIFIWVTSGSFVPHIDRQIIFFKL